ncbi:hypothetical protein CCH79_00003814 [Gambusia affinis]|uniref:Ig-like domain-containing protein n=1 Tax=Gambusia affinis TaxID=33528 RepID=A0A315VAK7_GAMAF|nr:hypothetical protein CCH79_00003814 [Gambusia affinis]
MALAGLLLPKNKSLLLLHSELVMKILQYSRNQENNVLKIPLQNGLKHVINPACIVQSSVSLLQDSQCLLRDSRNLEGRAWLISEGLWPNPESRGNQDSSVQSYIGLMELQTQPSSTNLEGTAGTLLQPPVHFDCSMSPLDTCTALETSFQGDSNVRRNKEVAVAYPGMQSTSGAFRAICVQAFPGEVSFIRTKTNLRDRSVPLCIFYRLPYLSDPVVPLMYQQDKVCRFPVYRCWLDQICAQTGSSGVPQRLHTARMYHYTYGRKSVQVWRSNQKDREVAVTSHCLDRSVISENAKAPTDYKMVRQGQSLMLNCTYNCSSGFVRGSWRTESDISPCNTTKSNGSLCTVSICLSNISTQDTAENYSCYTEDTEDPTLTKTTVHTIFLRLQGQFNVMKVLAAVTVTVAMVLAALAVFLCVNRNKPIWKGRGTLSTQSEKITLRIPPPDNDGDTEVPYADIMITVRGVSTPELTKVGYLGTGEWRGDEPRCHLQASRSADRLHVPQPREVSRKMSTNSEYATVSHANETATEEADVSKEKPSESQTEEEPSHSVEEAALSTEHLPISDITDSAEGPQDEETDLQHAEQPSEADEQSGIDKAEPSQIIGLDSEVDDNLLHLSLIQVEPDNETSDVSEGERSEYDPSEEWKDQEHEEEDQPVDALEEQETVGSEEEPLQSLLHLTLLVEPSPSEPGETKTLEGDIRQEDTYSAEKTETITTQLEENAVELPANQNEIQPDTQQEAKDEAQREKEITETESEGKIAETQGLQRSVGGRTSWDQRDGEDC